MAMKKQPLHGRGALKKYTHEIPTIWRTPNPNEYWGFHMAIKNQPLHGRGALKKYTHEKYKNWCVKARTTAGDSLAGYRRNRKKIDTART